jgi:hypothetical protein
VSNGYGAMRTALIALGIIAASLLAVAAIVNWQRVEVPPVGPNVEGLCAETTQRTPADLSWVAPDRAEKAHGREIKAVTLGEVPGHTGSLVRVAGVLHVEFEWVALYPSRAAMEATPHRPFVTTPPPPPPPTAAPPCSNKPAPPKPMADTGAGQEMLAEFNRLYETGEFQYCVADVQVNEAGTVDALRIVRPQNVDKRVESAIVRSMKSRRYNPATACGRPVPFRMSVGVGHCPSRAERKPDR